MKEDFKAVQGMIDNFRKQLPEDFYFYKAIAGLKKTQDCQVYSIPTEVASYFATLRE